MRVLTQNTKIGSAFGLANGILPVRVAGHTEDHVDDLRVEFNDGSAIYIQCKRSVYISESPSSEFGKAWAQFCRQVKLAMESRNSMRCALSYEQPNVALTALETLFARVREGAEEGKLANSARTNQEKASVTRLNRLHSKLRRAERDLPSLRDVVSMTYLHRLEGGDSSSARVESVESLQNGVLSDLKQTSQALNLLDTLGEELITTRGLSFDISGIRIPLRKDGVLLRDIPEFAADLRELDAEANLTLDTFHSEHRDQLGKRFTLDRPVVYEAIVRSAGGSFLITGEPGAGKTGVLMLLAKKLGDSGQRVWFLSVEGYEAKSLPGLQIELNLRHRLTDVFGFAAEAGPSILLVDGLDAARDRIKQATWRGLVREAVRQGITVIASIRFFDLRNSLPWQELFPRTSSEMVPNSVSGLEKVSFINVEDLSDEELKAVLSTFPKVRQLADSKPAIATLAKNIFNLRLLCELSEEGMPHNPIHTQLELLEHWWNKRIKETGGPEIENTVTKIVERMVVNRTLRTASDDLEKQALSDIEGAGLIRAVPPRPGFLPDSSVEFTHNVFFDYAAFRFFVFLRRDRLTSELSAPDSWGLFLRPSLASFFTWLWDNYRNDFWDRALDFQMATVPNLHKCVVWFAVARSVKQLKDFGPLLQGMAMRDAKREHWVALAYGVNGCGEAAVWNELFCQSSGVWWIEYARDLLRSDDLHQTNLGWQILYYLYYRIDHIKEDFFSIINEAARLEVEVHWSIADPFGPGAKPCICLFCRTISGNPQESAKLIRRIIEPQELAKSGYIRGHWICNEIASIARALPELAVEIYESFYGYRDTSTDSVRMGSSAVMSMRMSRHDMYAGAYHQLETGLTPFFKFSPQTATQAVCRAISSPREAHVNDERFIKFQFNNVPITIGDFLLHAEHLEQRFTEKTRLLAAWCDCLREFATSTNPESESKWKNIQAALAREADSPDVWAALLSVVPQQPAFFHDVVWPMLHSPDLLSWWTFKKFTDPCIRALAAITSAATLQSWQGVVLALTPADLNRHNYRSSSDALERLKASYLLCLPKEALTDAAQSFLAECKQENVQEYRPPGSRRLSDEERQMIERSRTGLDPDNPLHIQIEKDLARLNPAGLENIGPSILDFFDEVNARFQQVSSSVQTELRSQFQNRFSWAFRSLAEGKKRLTHKQLSRLLQFCEELLSTTAGRDNALEAIATSMRKKARLSRGQRALLKRVVNRPEPDVVEHFGIYIWPFLKSWPNFVWSCLDRWVQRMNEEDVAHNLRFVLQNSWFWWLYHVNRGRALKLLKRMLFNARQTANSELANGFLGWFTALAIVNEDLPSRKIVEESLSKPVDYGEQNNDSVRVLMEWLVPRAVKSDTRPEQLVIALDISKFFFCAARKALEEWQKQTILLRKEKAEDSLPWVQAVGHQFSHFSMELKFSAETHAKSLDGKDCQDCERLTLAWWQRAEPLFVELEKWLHPQIGHYLIDAIAAWLPYCPERCMHWLRRICEAGKRTGLLYEHLVIGNVVKILKNCLTEHKHLLSSDKTFLQDFAAVLESMLSVANAEALAMAASLDEFYR